MILVADSGSTKTTWIEVDSGNKMVTEGLNPHFSNNEAFYSACREIRQQLNLAPLTIFFYGAGCGDMAQRSRVKRLLGKSFHTYDVYVETDLLGACRAVSNDEASLVGILGTGSNACYYDGERITSRSPSLGYLLGDEGSANHMGRILLDRYLKGKMGMELGTLFHNTYTYSYEEWMDYLYHQPKANRFLASLARFAVEHSDMDECADIIRYLVRQWYHEQLSGLVAKSECRQLHVVGSFGKAIEEFLRETLSEYGLEVGTVVADPIEGLREYHLHTDLP